MKWKLSFATLVLAALSACGGSICTRLDAAQNAFYAGKTECSSSSGGVTITLKRSALTCSDSKCPSAADQKALENYVTCLTKAQACTSGNESAAVNAGTGCAFTLAGEVSSSCQMELSQ
ncbi:MAG: hypothetical protein U0228_35465 [Myxococcaceae bacterium]